MFSASNLVIFIWSIAMGITILGTLRALFFLRTENIAPKPQDAEWLEYPGISVLKPLKGIDPGLEKNLAGFFCLNYPNYELLFCVADSSDPAIPIVEKLLREHPGIAAKLLVGASQEGPNPKINNLLRSYELARYDWILISDSNTRFDPDYLYCLAKQFKDGADMQSAVIAGRHGEGLGGALEGVFLNTFYARSVIALEALGHTVVMGKAMMFRKSVMYRTRGLKALKRHIAEDYAAGRKFHILGHKVRLSRFPVTQHIGRHSLREFWLRHIRWGRLRKMQTPWTFITEPLLSSVLSGMLGAVAANQIWGIPMQFFFAAHFFAWFICDGVLATRVTGKLPAWNFPLTWTIREFIQLPLWLHIGLGNTVVWRGQIIRLKREKFLERRIDALEETLPRA